MYLFRIKNYFLFLTILLVSNVFATQNQIALTAQVGAVSVVGFIPVNGSSSTGSIFEDDTLNTVDFGSKFVTQTHSALTRDVYVLTNNIAGVKMTLSDATNSGNLKHSSLGDTIAVSYKFGANAIVLGTPFTLTSGVNAGSTSVGTMTFTPAAVPSTAPSGTYSTTLTVTIAAI